MERQSCHSPREWGFRSSFKNQWVTWRDGTNPYPCLGLMCGCCLNTEVGGKEVAEGRGGCCCLGEQHSAPLHLFFWECQANTQTVSTWLGKIQLKMIGSAAIMSSLVLNQPVQCSSHFSFFPSHERGVWKVEGEGGDELSSRDQSSSLMVENKPECLALHVLKCYVIVSMVYSLRQLPSSWTVWTERLINMKIREASSKRERVRGLTVGWGCVWGR